MALINTSLPNLIQGVSQQPDATRFSGQCDDQVNFSSSVVDGLTKRNGTRYVADLLPNDIGADSFVHFINRSEEERYVLIHDKTKLSAYNVITGAEATINDSLGGYTTAGTYLDVSDSAESARENLRATTVSDGTFIVNRTATVAVDNTDRSAPLTKEAMIFVKQGDYEKEYAVDINYSSETPATAQLSLTYKRSGNNYYVLTETSAVSVAGSGGSGYADGGIYHVVGYPATLSYAGVTYNLLTSAGVDPTVEVDSDTNGTITAASIANPGRRIYFTRAGGKGAKNIGSTVSITVTLEESPGLGGVTKYDNTANIKIFSENSEHAFHSDTSRITEILAKGASGTPALDIQGYNHNGTSTHSASANTGFEDVFSGINAGTNTEFTLTREGNLIVLTRASGKSDFKIKTNDGIAGGALGVVYKEVGTITDLPVYAKNGFRVKVRGDDDVSADDYYVEFKTDDQNQEIGPGAWQEVVAPNTVLRYDSNTLPLFITNNGVDSFELKPLATAPRIAGDDITNPFASFAGKKIQNSVFFKNRLGFICENNVILSESGLGARNDSGVFEYNFGRTTVTTLLDSDPIDVVVEAQRVVNLSAAAASQENLILFAENGQFVLKGEELLTPKTVSVKPVTNFEYNADTDPVSVGSYIYYPFDFGNHTGIREFSLNKDTDVYESNAITEQVPRYIPKDITRFSGSLSENTLAVLSKEDDQVLYIYKYFYSEGRKVLSSWAKWSFGSEVRGFEFMDSTLYLLFSNPDNNSTYLSYLPLNFDGLDEGSVDYTFTSLPSDATVTGITYVEPLSGEIHITHLDDRVPAIAVSGSGGWQIRFPNYTTGAERPLRENILNFNSYSAPVVFASGSGAANFVVYDAKGAKRSIDTSNFPSITITDGDGLTDGDPLWVGYEFNSKYTFSEQIFKAQAGQARTPNAAAKQFIKNLSLYHTRTSDYEIKVTPDKRSQYTNSFPATYDSASRVELKDGFFKAPVFASSGNLEIIIENNGAMPSNFQSAEFETFVHTRSPRYGA